MAASTPHLYAVLSLKEHTLIAKAEDWVWGVFESSSTGRLSPSTIQRCTFWTGRAPKIIIKFYSLNGGDIPNLTWKMDFSFFRALDYIQLLVSWGKVLQIHLKMKRTGLGWSSIPACCTTLGNNSYMDLLYHSNTKIACTLGKLAEACRQWGPSQHYNLMQAPNNCFR